LAFFRESSKPSLRNFWHSQGRVENLSQKVLGLPWGELIVTFLRESSKPLQGTFSYKEFKATYLEESLEPPQGTLSLLKGELRTTFPKESSKLPEEVLAFLEESSELHSPRRV
jgi:hypothetical protein